MTNMLNNLLQLQVDVLRMSLLTVKLTVISSVHHLKNTWKKLEDQIHLKDNEKYGLDENFPRFNNKLI
jgi:hypothetical protein